VTEPADLAHGVLIQVAAFLRTLPAEQLAELAAGEAKLEVVPKGGRRAGPGRAAAGGDALPHPAQEIAGRMAGIGDRAAARRYLAVDLKLTVPKLKRLAAELGITVPGRAKDPMVEAIVAWAVGRRLDADAIGRADAR
jgi:hypothetical protein